MTKPNKKPPAAQPENRAGSNNVAATRHQPRAFQLDTATRKGQESYDAGQLALAKACPPNELTWHQLALLAELDPELAKARWNEVKKQARDDLDTGHRAATVSSLQDLPTEKAQFLAIKESISEEWVATNGLEDRLVDMMAHSFTAWLFWMQRYTTRAMLEAHQEARTVGEFGKWQPPTVGEAAGLEQAVAMAERFNRIFLRTLRALRDLRRYSSTVTIQSAGQVNIGGQQVNAAQLGAGGTGESE